MKPVNTKPHQHVNFSVEFNKKPLSLRLVVRYKFKRVINQIGFMIKKSKSYD